MFFVIGFGLGVGALLPLLWVFRATRMRIYTQEALWPVKPELWFRLIAEFVTSVLLIVSAIGLAWQFAWAGPLHLLALGMLLYSLLRSPGDFVGRRRWAIILLSSTLLGGLLCSMLFLWRAGLVVT